MTNESVTVPEIFSLSVRIESPKGCRQVPDKLGGAPGFTTTTTVPGELVQPNTVAVTEYVPPFARVTFAIDGFCNAELKLFGPIQL